MENFKGKKEKRGVGRHSSTGIGFNIIKGIFSAVSLEVHKYPQQCPEVHKKWRRLGVLHQWIA